jgi:hypothetical protein
VDPFRDDIDFAAELRALRPAPRPAFAAELDERAAAGFPRRSSVAGSPPGRLVARVRALPPRRLAFSAGATALATLAVATVVVAVSEPDSSTAPVAALSGERQAGHVDKLTLFSGAGRKAKLTPFTRPAQHGAQGSSSMQFSRARNRKIGPYVFPAHHRNVERSAQMVLGADSNEVANDASRVFETVHAYDGIVLSSSVAGGAAGDAQARFELLIPAAKLGDALAAFSGIAEVRSRHDATDDITALTVSLGEDLQDSRAKIAGLLVQLAGADSASECAEVEAELHAERHRAASLRSRVTKLNRRANLSRVSLRIESGDTSASDGSGSSWGAGDALGDAGHILGIAAGVAIVGLAIVVPLALIALLSWLAGRAWVRRSRERVLD